MTKRILSLLLIAVFLNASVPVMAAVETMATVWEASNGKGRHAGTIAGYDYELWSQDGTGTAVMTVTGDAVSGGTFNASWSNTLNVLFRAGKKFTDANGMDLANPSQKGKTHDEIGNMSIDFVASEFSTGDDLAMVSVYGWAYFKTAPSATHDGKPHPFSSLIEYYIVQTRGVYHPGRGGTKKGEATIDGIVYEFFETDRIGQHALTGSAVNFKQYWSFPKSTADHRTGGMISVSEHFAEWAKLGMVMDGPFYEVAMKIESYTGGRDGSGTASIAKNILKIGDDDPEPEPDPEPGPEPEPEVPNLETAGEWARPDLTRAIEAGIVPQELQGEYTAEITRVEFSALAVAIYEAYMGKPITERKTFTDTTDPNAEKAAGVGIVTGNTADTFNPSGVFNRQGAARLMVNLLEAMGIDLPKEPAGFADSGSIADWALVQVGQASAAGLMGSVGDNKFNPMGPFTRQQAIILMLNVWDYLQV